MNFNCDICNEQINSNRSAYMYKDSAYCSLCCIEIKLEHDNNKELHKLLKSKIMLEKQIKIKN